MEGGGKGFDVTEKMDFSDLCGIPSSCAQRRDVGHIARDGTGWTTSPIAAAPSPTTPPPGETTTPVRLTCLSWTNLWPEDTLSLFATTISNVSLAETSVLSPLQGRLGGRRGSLPLLRRPRVAGRMVNFLAGGRCQLISGRARECKK